MMHDLLCLKSQFGPHYGVNCVYYVDNSNFRHNIIDRHEYFEQDSRFKCELFLFLVPQILMYK